MDRNLRREAVRHKRRRHSQPARPAAERDGGDLLDARESAIATSGISRITPSPSANAAPGTK